MGGCRFLSIEVFTQSQGVLCSSSVVEAHLQGLRLLVWIMPTFPRILHQAPF